MQIRRDRQSVVYEWCKRAFGLEQTCSVRHRGLRLLEEAVELYQAAGGTGEMAHKLVDYVFARPAGEIRQEAGGVAVTLLALAEAAGFDADEEEVREIERVTDAFDPEHFTRRNAAKCAAGFDAT